ncbi:LacI family DNA-binding transcriptional regulator [Microbacterium stercoris]|uniref:LacI family DNA-binding transcriptional regulator n=1 Tax=Microbacterium stercoris TaxID=2820289 RepID=A0A939TM09_9MICO|nr:LacI family DNA-binding transcriptional regulator [Microbacterium stercoris]MBO3662698.1 LacI family DNA-binding transcriptional regulator [Microbacterium stercoris]
MAQKRVTLADVARRAGLSPTAASMILNGRPDTRLSQEAHERVHAAAEELGYRPNVSARALRTATTHTLGFVSDMIATTRFASGLITGALSAAQAAGHVVLVAETGGDPARETEAIAALLDRQVDGIIFATMRARELFVPELPAGTSAIMLNATNARYHRAVLPDEYAGGRAAIQALLRHGHAAGIALLGQNDEVERNVFRSATIAQRAAGLRSAMSDAGLHFMAEASLWEWEPENGYDGTLRLLDLHPEIRAIVCMNDRLAFGAYQALAERGLRVPQDVSIVSFDNDEIAAYLRPGLTTIALPHEEMGRRAVERLIDREDEAGVTSVRMPIVERQSIAAPRP